jgi:hypothetical protein
MTHLEHDILWSLSRTELDEMQTKAARVHLEECAECRVALEDIQIAQSVLSALPDVPAMPEQMARRVGAQLAEAADAQVAKRFTSWWQSLFTPRFVFAAALGLVLVTAGAYLLAEVTEQPQTPTQIALPSPTVPAPNPIPAPQPQQLAKTPAKKLSVTVASAKKSTASKSQVLAEGSTVSTHSGGSVWMKLPDGTRAGLTATSEVKLATLEEKQLTLDLNKGSLAMVVPHREDRVLTVRAGDLEVKDLGTRFLVSRDQGRTLVAVEEGKVEVTTPAGKREVTANHAVTWSNGQLNELAWETTAPSAPQTALTPEPVAEGQPNSIARLTDEPEDDSGPPPEELVLEPLPDEQQAAPQAPDRTPIDADENWAGLPQKDQPPAPNLAPRRMGTTNTEKGFSLKNIERKLREVGTVITSPSGREAAARNVQLTADAGDCHHALRLADRWLSDPITGAPNEPAMRRNVQLQQVRCLNHLGRTQDAETILKMIQIQTAH